MQSTGSRYDFDAGGLVNVDVSAIVRFGRPPSGAHSDICHPELGWLALNAATLV